MAYTIECTCPKCGQKANGFDEITLLFGWRTVNGKNIPQSHCMKCRGSGKNKENTND